MQYDHDKLKRYGYISQGDIPHITRPNRTPNRERPGMLKILGDLAITAVSVYTGAMILRKGGMGARRLMESAESPWLKSVAREMGEVGSLLEDIESGGRRMQDGVPLSKIARMNVKSRRGTGWKRHLPDDKYLKTVLASRTAAYARRVPYEIPAFYVVDRTLIDREQTKEDIRSGAFNPYNPINLLGDIAKRSAGFIAFDAMFQVVSPISRDVYRAAISHPYKDASSVVKSLKTARIVNQQALGEAMADLTDVTNKGIIGARGIGRTLSEANTLVMNQQLGIRDRTAGIRDTSMGPAKGTPQSKSSLFGDAKGVSAYTGKAFKRNVIDPLRAYNMAGPLATVRTAKGIEPVLPIHYNRLLTEITGIKPNTQKRPGNRMFQDAMRLKIYGDMEERLVKEGMSKEVSEILIKDVGEHYLDLRKISYRFIEGQVSTNDIFQESYYNALSSGSFDDLWAQSSASISGGHIAGRLGKLFGKTPYETPTKDTIKSVLSVAEESVNSLYQTRQSVVGDAWRQSKSMLSANLREYSELLGSGKVVLSSFKNKDQLRAMLGKRGLEAYGNNIRTLRTEEAWKQWKKAIGSTSDEQAELFTTGVLKQKGMAVDTMSQQFNFLGLRRLTLAESFRMQTASEAKIQKHGGLDSVDIRNRERQKLVGELWPTSTIGATGETADAAKELRDGWSILAKEVGSGRAANILSEKGLYINTRGEVADFRAAISTGYNALEWIEKNTRTPIAGFNFLQMTGSDGWLDSMRSNRIRRVKAGAEHFVTRERDWKNKLSPYSPLYGVSGKNAFAYTREGQIQNIGKVNWTRNVSGRMFQKLARLAAGESRVKGYKQGQEGVGKYSRGLLDSDTKNFLVRMPFSNKKRNFGKVLEFLDVSEDTSGSLIHKANRWIKKHSQRERTITDRLGAWNNKKYKGIFGKSAGRDLNKDYVPNWLNDQVTKIDDLTRRASQEDIVDEEARKQFGIFKEKIHQIRRMLNSETSDEGLAVIEDMMTGLGINPVVKNTNLYGGSGQALKQMIKNLEGSIDTMSKNARFVSRRQPTVGNLIPSAMFIDEGGSYRLSKTLQSKLTNIENIAGIDDGFRLNAESVNKVRQELASFQLLITSSMDDESSMLLLEQMQRTLGESLATKRITPKIYREVLAKLTANKLHITAATRSWGTSQELLAETAELATDMLGGRGLGITGGFRNAMRGNKPLGTKVRDAYQMTVGNDMWMSSSAGVLEDTGVIANVFGNSPWIAFRPFTERLGFGKGVREISRLAAGTSMLDDTLPGVRPGRTLMGAVTGDALGGDVTTGTLFGWHAVTRVADTFEKAGIGLTYSNYRNPLHLFTAGVMGKRALPIVAGMGAFSLAAGVPGVGAEGAMGAAAWGMGPGAGYAKSGALTATSAINDLTQAAVGVRPLPDTEFFSTLADVTDMKEDSFVTGLGRTPEEEQRYWQEGDVPVRQGRFWVLSSTPFFGGKVSYYKPNWYRGFKSQYEYTEDFKGSHAEWAMFGTDISPGKYIDPYHYERKHYNTRPYPVTGDLFTGPWGPATPLLNTTIGNIVKPKMRMHAGEDQLAMAMGIAGMDEARMGSVLSVYKTGMHKDSSIHSFNATSMAPPKMRAIGKARGLLNGEGFEISSGGSGQLSEMYASGTYSNRMTGNATIIDNSAKSARAIESVYGVRAGSRPIEGMAGGFIPKEYAKVLLTGSSREGQFKYHANPAESQSGNSLLYRAGELGYLSQEWGGFYGFAAGVMGTTFGMDKDHAPDAPVLESADRMYGTERAFWDLGLGGLGDFPLMKVGNLEFSEVTRRFIPHRRRQTDLVNEIPNRMPAWLPGFDGLINFRAGDPYVKIPLGEARLPGAGYQRLNTLHPDGLGMYGAVDRMKILADVMPWSEEYKFYTNMLERSSLTPEEQAIVSESKRRASARKQKIPLSKRSWSGDIEKAFGGVSVSQSEYDPNMLRIPGYEHTVRMAGVRFSKSEEGREQARRFYDTYLRGKSVSVYTDSESAGPELNREKTQDAILKVSGQNINKIALGKINSGEMDGSEAQSQNYIDKITKMSLGWATVGKMWEGFSHAEIPILHAKFTARYSADEWLEQKMVYGKQWQPWETPYASFIKPAVQSFTKTERNPLQAGLATGWLAAMFFKGGTPKLGAALTGGVLGAGLNVSHHTSSFLTGQSWVPQRRREEYAADEYLDILKYLKYSNLYEMTRIGAMNEEGVDPETLVNTIGEYKEAMKTQERLQWDSAPVGQKPPKPKSEKILKEIGPLTSRALQLRKRMQGTMYGTPLKGDFDANYMAVPKRFRAIYQNLVETPVSKRGKTLDMMPRMMRRIFQSQWGMDIEERPELEEYFEKHELPGPDWEGWLPQVNLDEIGMKLIDNEGLDTSEFGIYPSQLKEAKAMPWGIPEMHRPNLSSNQIEEQLMQMGATNIDVNYTDVPGVNVDVMYDTREDVRSFLASGFSS